MIVQTKNETRVNYLIRVAIHYLEENPEHHVEYDDATCDGLCLAEELKHELVDDIPTIDIDECLWSSIKTAAEESSWMPPDYMMNDWVADVCLFLRNGDSE
jgi:hypothetical protein